jgi:hypothetical protein
MKGVHFIPPFPALAWPPRHMASLLHSTCLLPEVELIIDWLPDPLQTRLHQPGPASLRPIPQIDWLISSTQLPLKRSIQSIIYNCALSLVQRTQLCACMRFIQFGRSYAKSSENSSVHLIYSNTHRLTQRPSCMHAVLCVSSHMIAWSGILQSAVIGVLVSMGYALCW